MWQVSEAKNKFSELFTRALTEGPQRVRRRKESVVVISAADYERLTRSRPRISLGEYILNGPSLEGLDLTRDRSEGREVDLGPDDAAPGGR
ncbi:MAG: type II toxin-antitoxin system prevent-host-death family antitoxin [Pseudomonadota bacterium]